MYSLGRHISFHFPSVPCEPQSFLTEMHNSLFLRFIIPVIGALCQDMRSGRSDPGQLSTLGSVQLGLYDEVCCRSPCPAFTFFFFSLRAQDSIPLFALQLPFFVMIFKKTEVFRNTVSSNRGLVRCGVPPADLLSLSEVTASYPFCLLVCAVSVFKACKIYKTSM